MQDDDVIIMASDGIFDNLKEEHILVKISAAGMDFFDPVKFPKGIYNPTVGGSKMPNKLTNRRVLPSLQPPSGGAGGGGTSVA